MLIGEYWASREHVDSILEHASDQLVVSRAKAPCPLYTDLMEALEVLELKISKRAGTALHGPSPPGHGTAGTVNEACCAVPCHRARVQAQARH